MAAILNEQTQYVDASGRPLAGGSVYIGDVSADPVANPKSIFSDRAMTAALANPQTLDANGRATNKMWTDGKYSLQVRDINGAQVFQDLDRGESAVTIDILNDITDVITTPANNDTLILTRDEAQSKITFANLFSATNTSIAGLQAAIDAIPAVLNEDGFATDSETQPPSQQSVAAYVAAYVNGLALGVGQAWQDVTGSRAALTTYQNTTGRPIMVNIVGRAPGGRLLRVSTDNFASNDVTVAITDGTSSNDLLSAVIPPGHYYQLGDITVSSWSELR